MKIRHIRGSSRVIWFCYPKNRRQRHNFHASLTIFMFFVSALLISTSATATSCSGTEADGMIRCSITITSGGEGAQVQHQAQDGKREQITTDKSKADTGEAEFKKASMMEEEDGESSVRRQMWIRKKMRRSLLGGLGSYPPRCMSKCGRCNPCKPVHVAVPPGTPVTTEYYPEAWRCKCGNRLYIP